MVAADFRRNYPALADVPITHDWGGPIDRTPTSLPILGHLGGREHIVYGVGWSGNGVGPSYVGGRILASLALGDRRRVGAQPPGRPPAGPVPARARALPRRALVREAVIRKERSELAGREPRKLAVADGRARARRARGQEAGTAYGTPRYGNPADGTAPRRP